MREAGAEEALVSGSGPTVVGLFGHANPAGRAQRAAAELRGRVPEPIAAKSVGAAFARATTLG
jgi:4-diphosphocytidyl-2-C-methyl-D-erythritol kinase